MAAHALSSRDLRAIFVEEIGAVSTENAPFGAHSQQDAVATVVALEERPAADLVGGLCAGTECSWDLGTQSHRAGAACIIHRAGNTDTGEHSAVKCWKTAKKQRPLLREELCPANPFMLQLSHSLCHH